MKTSNLLILISLILTSCTGRPGNYGPGKFPEAPVNFEEINSEYDDYNSAYPPNVDETFPLCFSSSRNSLGVNFDIIYKLISINLSTYTKEFSIYEETNSNYDENIVNALAKINTPFNEYGPYFVHETKFINEKYILLYSNNENGNQDILFTENITNNEYCDPIKVKFLNSEFDDMYPTFNRDCSEIYFCSNRESVFNIYRVKIDTSKSIIANLSDNTKLNVEKVTALSSDYDDKCPYIIGNFMIFASNREGGYGSYDLYYSKYENGEWQTPVNFGDKINSAYDEFRPIVRIQYGFLNSLMFFSSNRPGGKGGFDLYYVGIEKLLYYY